MTLPKAKILFATKRIITSTYSFPDSTGELLRSQIRDGRRRVFKMRLTHQIEISLSLFCTTLHLARFGFGPVTLTTTLRLDTTIAAFDSTTASSFVFYIYSIRSVTTVGENTRIGWEGVVVSSWMSP